MRKVDLIRTLRQKIANYEILDIQKNALNELYEYFTSAVESKKGICLYGEYGTGKSSIMEAFEALLSWEKSNKQFSIYSERQIARMFQEKCMNELLENNIANQFGILHNFPKNICIDDANSINKKIKYYGNELMLFEELLLDRYDIMKQYGKVTHLTTNAITNLFEGLDGRVIDRLKEMFIFINLPGLSQRK